MEKRRKINVKALQAGSQSESLFLISLDEELGKGQYGCVYKCYNSRNLQEALVCKVIPISNAQTKGNLKFLHSIQRELKALERLNYNANLVNYKKIKLGTDNNQYFIMEYCNDGSVLDIIESGHIISEREIYEFLYQICNGYKELQANNILHRDIKPENIMMHNRIYKLGDFGLSKIIEEKNMEISVKGSPFYMAPELVQKFQEKSDKIDMFSLGVVLYQMVYNQDSNAFSHPYIQKFHENYRKDPWQLVRDVGKSNLVDIVIPQYPVRSPNLVNILKRMVNVNPQQRISWEQLSEITEIKDVFKSSFPLQLKNKPQNLMKSWIDHQQFTFNNIRTSELTQLVELQDFDNDCDETLQEQIKISFQTVNLQQKPQESMEDAFLKYISEQASRQQFLTMQLKKVENFLLYERELILFYDKIAIDFLDKLSSHLQLQSKEVNDLTNNLLENILTFGIIKLDQLKATKNLELEDKFSEQDMEFYKNSEFCALFNQVMIEDRQHLGEFLTSFLQKNKDINQSHIINENILKEQIKEYFDVFSDLTYDIDQQSSHHLFLLFRYLIDIYWLLQKSDKSGLQQKEKRYFDIWRYYEQLEKIDSEVLRINVVRALEDIGVQIKYIVLD